MHPNYFGGVRSRVFRGNQPMEKHHDDTNFTQPCYTRARSRGSTIVDHGEALRHSLSAHMEPVIYGITDRMAADYKGGYWDFYTLSNGGFYMAPSDDRLFHVTCDNCFEGDLSGDALGLTSCLYAYSHLSFAGDFAREYARHYHRLRGYLFEHAEVKAILGAID